MINEFIDWMYETANEVVFLLFVISLSLLTICVVVMFVAFEAPPELLRLTLLPIIVIGSIFTIWYFKEYKK